MTSPSNPPVRWFFLGTLLLSAAVTYGLALPLGAGAVLGYITEKRVDRLLDHLKKSENPRWREGLTGAVIVGTLLLVVLPVGIAVYIAAQDLIRLIARFDWNQIARWTEQYGTPLQERLTNLGVDVSTDQLRTKATELIAGSAGAVASLLGTALSSTPEALFNAAMALFAWFIFATTGRETRNQVLPQIVPWPSILKILRETTAEVLESVIIANILVSAVQSLVCSIPLVVLGVPRALVWGILSFFLSFIPVVGTLPITLGAALWCYSQGRVAAAIFMVVVAVVVGSIDNILRPLFMRSSKTELSTLWLLVALTSGVTLFGVAGIILGPLFFSLFVAFSQALTEQNSPVESSENKVDTDSSPAAPEPPPEEAPPTVP